MIVDTLAGAEVLSPHPIGLGWDRLKWGIPGRNIGRDKKDNTENQGIRMAQSTQQAKQLRVGLVGLGRAGSAFIQPIVRHPGLTISAAAEVERETLERFGRDFPVHLYSNAEDLCRDPDVDAVYVATPTQFHTEHVLTALEHHKHVLVAKPMAVTLEDG